MVQSGEPGDNRGAVVGRTLRRSVGRRSMLDSRVGAGGRRAGSDRCRVLSAEPDQGGVYNRESRPSQAELAGPEWMVVLPPADDRGRSLYAGEWIACGCG